MSTYVVFPSLGDHTDSVSLHLQDTKLGWSTEISRPGVPDTKKRGREKREGIK